MKIQLRKAVEQKIRARVRRGARKLDKIAPDWFKPHSGVKLTQLDQRSACFCVWGQLRGAPAGANEAFQDAWQFQSEDLGYYPGNHESVFVSPELAERTYPTDPAEQDKLEAIRDEEWRVLQDEWEAQIRLRRNAAKAA